MRAANLDAEQPWLQPGWMADVSAWINEQLGRLATEITGPIEQTHIRPWSTVLRVPVTGGEVFFKAPMRALGYEVPLTRDLARWHPECTLPVLAADAERRWMILPDGRQRLRELVREEGTIRHWDELLPVYAALQIDLVSRSEELRRLGVHDRGLRQIPYLTGCILRDRAVLHIGEPDGLTEEELVMLTSYLPRIAEWCRALADCGVPESLNHGDLHDGNIFVLDGRYRFLDWSDCGITHPFFSLRTAMISVETTLGWEEGAPLEPLWRAYREPWTEFVPGEQLDAAFELAQRLWMLYSVLPWYHIVSRLTGEMRLKYAYAIPALLREFLEVNEQESV
ncbi:MAG TPA: phosphotransferase [Chloroflexota bacterium]